MRSLVLFLLTLIGISFAQTEAATQPELVFQVGAFNQAGSEGGLFIRFWVKGGEFDSELSSSQFGRIEYGRINVKAPDGSLAFQRNLDYVDPRRVQHFSSSQAFQPGVYSASVAFIYRGELQQFDQVISVSEADLIDIPEVRIDAISKGRLSVSWQSVGSAEMYEVAFLAENGQVLSAETVREPSLVLELESLNLDTQTGVSYQIIVTALTRSEASSGLINASAGSALVRPAQSEANTDLP